MILWCSCLTVLCCSVFTSLNCSCSFPLRLIQQCAAVPLLCCTCLLPNIIGWKNAGQYPNCWAHWLNQCWNFWSFWELQDDWLVRCWHDHDSHHFFRAGTWFQSSKGLHRWKPDVHGIIVEHQISSVLKLHEQHSAISSPLVHSFSCSNIFLTLDAVGWASRSIGVFKCRWMSFQKYWRLWIKKNKTKRVSTRRDSHVCQDHEAQSRG